MNDMEGRGKRVLNFCLTYPRALESEWISLIRQIGFLNAACQERGIALDFRERVGVGFQWEAPNQDGPSVCISLMKAPDFSEDERTDAIELLRHDGVACVIILLKSEERRAAFYEIDGAALYIIHYREPSEIRIVELQAVQKLLDALIPDRAEGDADEDDWTMEIHPGLIVGTGQDLLGILLKKPDAIVALDSIPGEVWDDGFRGNILYYPIKPYGVLPFFIMERLAVEVGALLEDRQRVALFCSEDCGRIGYVAACVLFLRGIREPVDWLRQKLGAQALSVSLQEDSVRMFCYRHVARSYWNCVQLTRHIQIDSIDTFRGDEEIRRSIHQIKESLDGKGRMTFRFSGLLPSVRIMVEAPDMQQCERVMDELINAVKRSGHYLGRIHGW